MTRTQITLRSGRRERFLEVKEKLEDRRGHELTNVEVVSHLLGETKL